MVAKWFESFYKYRHIYNFLCRGGKYEEDIKAHLMEDLGISESTARYQLQGALDEECGLVKRDNGKYQIALEKVEEMIEYLFRFYPMVMCAIPKCKKDYYLKMADDYELKILQFQMQLAEMEKKYHEAEIQLLWNNISYSNSKSMQAHQIDIRRLKDDIKRYKSRIEKMKEKRYE